MSSEWDDENEGEDIQPYNPMYLMIEKRKTPVPYCMSKARKKEHYKKWAEYYR